MPGNHDGTVFDLEAYLAEPVPTLPDDPREREQAIASEGEAEQRDWDVQTLARCVFILGLVGFAAGLFWFGMWYLRPLTIVDPHIQVLQIDREQGVAWLEPPQKMRDYVLPEEILVDLTRRFIRDYRRKGKDEVDNEERQLSWKAHACGSVDVFLQSWAKPPQEIVLVSVNDLRVIPTRSPRTLRASWQELWRTAKLEVKSEHRYVADVTYERFQPTNQDTLERNHSGICVTDLSPTEVLP